MEMRDGDDCAIVCENHAAVPQPVVEVQLFGFRLADRHHQGATSRWAFDIRMRDDRFQQR
jgi:hypothetical protein